MYAMYVVADESLSWGFISISTWTRLVIYNPCFANLMLIGSCLNAKIM